VPATEPVQDAELTLDKLLTDVLPRFSTESCTGVLKSFAATETIVVPLQSIDQTKQNSHLKYVRVYQVQNASAAEV